MSSKIHEAVKKLKGNSDLDLERDRVDLDPDRMRTHDVISTGSLMVDYIIGGSRTASGERQCPGIPRSRMTEVFGPEGSGKTTLMLHAAAEVQRQEGEVAFFDFENAIDPDWADTIGVSLSADDFFLAQPNSMEDGTEMVDAFVQEGVDLLIIDSVPAMVPKKARDANVSDDDPGGIGLRARKMARFLERIADPVSKNEVALVFINQTRTSINMGWGSSSETTPGGNALGFFTSLRLRLEAVKQKTGKTTNELTGEKIKQPLATRVECEVIKSKVSSHQHKKGRFTIRFDQGIDNLSTLMKMGQHNGYIWRNGAWYYAKGPEGEIKKHGEEKMRKELVDNDALRQYIMDQVLEEDVSASESETSADGEDGGGEEFDGDDEEENDGGED